MGRDRRACVGVLVLASSLAGCGDDPVPAAPPRAADPSIERPGDRGPVAGPCSVDEVLEDGACRPPGAAACGAFQTRVGDRCVALKPPTPCAPGEVHDAVRPICRPIVACPDPAFTAAWGRRDVVHVWGGSGLPPGGGDGSVERPYGNLVEAVAAAPAGATVAVRKGYYGGDLLVERPLTVVGECPTQVRIVGVDPKLGAFSVGTPGASLEVRGVGVEGPGLGFIVLGGLRVDVANTWIHGAQVGIGVFADGGFFEGSFTGRGVLVEDVDHAVYVDSGRARFEDLEVRDVGGIALQVEVLEGPAEVTFDRLRIERAVDVALLWAGADVAVADALVLGVRRPAGGTHVPALSDAAGGGRFSGRRILVEDVEGVGMSFGDSDVELEDVTLRDVRRDADAVEPGYGLGFFSGADPQPERRFVARRLTIEQVDDVGLLVSGRGADVRSALVRDVGGDDPLGAAAGIALTARSLEGPAVRLAASRVERVIGYGALVQVVDVAIEGLAVTDIRPSVGTGGLGVLVQGGLGQPGTASAAIRDLEVGGASGAGLAFIDAAGTVDSARLVGTRWEEGGPTFGYGFVVQGWPTPDGIRRSTVAADRVLVADNDVAGVLVVGSDLELRRSIVRGTRSGGGVFGDNLVVTSMAGAGDLAASRVVVGASDVQDAARAGVLCAGAAVELSDVWLACNPIALDGEPALGAPFDFRDGGGNRCGCGASETPCRVLSHGLRVPEAL